VGKNDTVFVQMRDGRFVMASIGHPDRVRQLFVREESLVEVEQILVIDDSQLSLHGVPYLRDEPSSSNLFFQIADQTWQRFTNHFLTLIRAISSITDFQGNLAAWVSSLFKREFPKAFAHRCIIVLMTRSGRLHGFDTQTRRLLWSITIEHDGKTFLGMTFSPSTRLEIIPELMIFHRSPTHDMQSRLQVIHIHPNTGKILKSVHWSPASNFVGDIIAVYALPSSHEHSPFIRSILLSRSGKVGFDMVDRFLFMLDHYED
jgi:hypothetical protein